MTLSISRDDLRSGMLKTKAEPPVSDQEMEQAVRTLLLGWAKTPIAKGCWIPPSGSSKP
jgi:GTP cyclohydrolase I